MTGIIIFGSAGRMGGAVYEALVSSGAHLAGVDQPDIDNNRRRDPPPRVPLEQLARGGGDVIIDFTSPDVLEENLWAAQVAKKPIVIGTTGLTDSHHAIIDRAARSIPVLWSANMSLGVNLLAALVKDAASRLSVEWDIEILEMHHRHKVDAPSGTALMLGDAAAAGRGIDLDGAKVTVRDGITGERQYGDIGFATLRGGSVAGDHQVIFAAEGERLELGHRAEGRVIFARGAIKAAQWLVGKEPGRYTMAQVLGL